ncbi:Oidioi.mRNA.OKI2018_I69.XSR.g13648.t1.cds [Oikopleura dioica]|uniref:Oidioi.mRNA.OKI2018_I69.XSR.g13648.t1.cds n=1 Tax=Oikopleura dioica TaxID=34765 RepID=A0ABN7SC71_OIKDI|nr:Oidioi.mRNA.OKI2018_I69.XSR.g13648.t1.cds [Oikopleura dioica]
MKKIIFGLLGISTAQLQYSAWGEWTEWGPCSISSDYGSRIRHRSCNSGAYSSCAGEDYQVEECTEKPVNCIVPSLPLNSSFVNCTSTAPGSTCEIACHSGFLPSGETRLTCTDYGWSAEFGSCVPIPSARCPALETPENGKIICSDSSLSSSECLLYCDPGFQPSGESSTICDENGQWNAELGKCLKAKCTFEQKEYYAGVSILTDNCRQECTCTDDGLWRCKHHYCKSHNEQCILDIESTNYKCQERVDCYGPRSWSSWINSNTPTNGNERESAQKARNFHPEAAVCKQPDAIEARRVRDQKSVESLLQDGWRIFVGDDKVVCRKRDQISEKEDCEDMEIRFCCEEKNATPECPDHIGTWTKWANADRNPNDGGDFELLSRHRALDPEGVCEVPHSIDFRQVNETLDWEVKYNQKITTDPQMGLVCYDQANSNSGGCGDYEVRFCCSAPLDLSCLRQRPPWNGNRPDPTWLPPDRCCGNRPYNSNLKTCCEGERLVQLEEDCTENSY